MKKKSVSSFVFNSFVNDSRVLKEAISLHENNYDVQVVAHKDVNLKAQEIIEGITIKRVSFLNRKKASTLNKAYAYFKFIIKAVQIGKKTDILHCNDLNTLPIAFLIKKIYNSSVKIIYDAHEYETEMNHLSKKAKKIMAFFEKRLIKHVDKTITVSESIAIQYKKLYPFIDTPSIVLNCPKTKLHKTKNNIFRTHFSIKEEDTIFLYQGSLSKGRGLETIIQAFQHTKNKNNVLVIMGYGGLEDYVKEISAKETNIYFHEAVLPSVLLKYTSSADFGISTIENTCLSYYYCLPNKMFEYIMAEIPLIVSNLPEMKKVVMENAIGVVAEKNTAEGILIAIEKANELDLNEVKNNLIKTKAIYNWENQEKVLLKTYKSLFL